MLVGFPERQFRRRPKHPNHLVKVKENHIMTSYLAILPAALLLLAAAGCAIYRTDWQGTVTITATERENRHAAQSETG